MALAVALEANVDGGVLSTDSQQGRDAGLSAQERGVLLRSEQVKQQLTPRQVRLEEDVEPDLYR